MPRTLFGGKSPTPLDWQPLPHMEEWLDNLAADETSQGYINAAKAGMAHFGLFARGEGIKHPDELTRHHILRFQAYLTNYRKENGDPLSASYRQQLMKYVRNWINWMLEVEHIETSPWVRIRIGRTVKVPKPLEDDEIVLLFETHRKAAFSIPPFYYHRREVILVLLYGWGLRINELASLTVAALDMRQDWVTIRNKSPHGTNANSTKVLPYNEQMKQVLMRYLNHRGKHAVAGEDSLLIDQHGGPLTTHVIRKIVTELGARAGIQVNPHRLRDSYATTMLDNDVEAERLQKLLGHSNLPQTLAYARVNDPKLKESHDRVMTPLLNTLLNGQLP